MEERAAARVLAGEADGIALFEDAGVRERLGAAPVERQFAGEHLHAVRHDLRDARMQREVVREAHDAGAERLEARHVAAALHALGPVVAEVLAPVDGVLVADHAERRARLRTAFVEALAIRLDHGRGFRVA